MLKQCLEQFSNSVRGGGIGGGERERRDVEMAEDSEAQL